MKRIFKILLLPFLCLIVVFGLSSCSNEGNDPGKEPDDKIKLDIRLEDKTVTYDGKTHSLEVKGEVPSDIKLSYENNDKVNAGEYVVTCNVIDEQNKYQPMDPLKAKLIINKADYDMSNIKFDDVAVNYDGNPHSLAITGDLPDKVTVSYTNNEKTAVGTYEVVAKFATTDSNYNAPKDMKANLTINKKDFDMSAITFEDKTVTYDGNEHELLISGTLPKGITVSYENNKFTNAGSYIAVAKFSHTNTNYNEIPDMTALLNINKADYDLSGITFEDKVIPYDGEEHFIIISGTLPNGVAVLYENNKLTEVGSVDAVAKFTHTDLNYNNIPDMTAKLTITKGGFDINSIKFEDKVVTYDGNEHELLISGTLPSDITVSYENNKLTDVGTVNAKAIFTTTNANYDEIPTLEASLTINKADFDLSEIKFEDTEVTYDGEEHELLVSGTLPSGVTAVYTNNKLTNAGSSEAKVKFTHSNTNYNEITKELTATLTVNKAVYDLSGITFDKYIVTYDGEEHELLISGTLPEGVTVTYKNNKSTNACYEIAEANFHSEDPNYEELGGMIAIFNIQKKVIQEGDIIVEEKTVTYDGNPHSIEVSKMPKGLTVTYENNNQTDAGNYIVYVKFIDSNPEGNFEGLENKAVPLTINKADYDLSGITFTDKTVDYDGTEHELLISGTLPSGVTAVYSSNKLTNAGTSNAKVTFTHSNKNYNEITKELTAKLTVNKKVIDLKSIKFEDKTYTYDGKEKTLTITSPIPEYMEVSYSDNKLTNAGKLTVTATFTSTSTNYELINNELNANLIIEKAVIKENMYTVTNDTYTYDGKPHNITVTVNEPSITATIISDDCINARDTAYRISVEFTSNNYIATTLTFPLKINKAKYDPSMFTFEDKTVTYDGTLHYIYINGTEEDKAKFDIYYEGNGNIGAGEYTVTANIVSLNNNYENLPKMTATLIINKADIDITGKLSVYEASRVYNGEPQTFTVTGNIDKVRYYVYDNVQTDAGKYKLTVNFEVLSTDYNKIPDIQLDYEITKAKVDISRVHFDDENFTYSGNPKSIKVRGDLPTDFTINYTNNNKSEVGTHEVTANFICSSNNYEPIAPLKANINILDDGEFYNYTFVVNGKIYRKSYIKGTVIDEYPTIEEKPGYQIIGNVPTYADRNNMTITIESKPNMPQLQAYIYIDGVLQKPISYIRYDASVTHDIASMVTIDNCELDHFNVDGHGKDKTTINIDEAGLRVHYYFNTIKYNVIYVHENKVVLEEKANLSGEYSVKAPGEVSKWSTFDKKTVYNANDSITDFNGKELILFSDNNNLTLEGYTFTLDEVNKTVTINSYPKDVENLVIPQYYVKENTLYEVVKLSKAVYDDKENKVLKTVYLPDSIERINEYMFINCTELTTVKLPKNLYYIGQEAFKNCAKLQEIELPDSLTHLTRQAFADCTSLTSIVLPDNLEFIQQEVFQGCSGLISVDMGNNKTVQTSMFNGCTSLTTVSLNNVEVIGMFAFNNCKSLTEINIPSSVKYIKSSGFNGCTNLVEIHFNAPLLENGGNYKAENQKWYIDYPLEEFLTTSLSYDLKPTTEIYLKNSLGEYELLTELFVKKGTNFYGYPLRGYSKLTSITFEEGTKFIPDGLVRSLPGLTTLNIPDSVTTIGKEAISNLPSLTTLKLPANLKTVKYRGISDLKLIEELVIPEGCEYIDNLSDLMGLKTLKLPSTLTFLEMNLNLYENQLTNIYYNGSLSELLNISYSYKGINTTGKIYCNNELLTKLVITSNDPVSHNIVSNETITEVEYMEGVTEIDMSKLIYYGTNLKTIRIPHSVTSINYDNSFQDRLTVTVYYAGTIEEYKAITVKGNPFYLHDLYCNGQKITSITISDNEDHSVNSVFTGCTSIKSIVIEEGITTLKTYAFAYCKSLESVKLPSTLTTLRDNAFYYCDKLEMIDLPSSVTNIQVNALNTRRHTYIKINGNMDVISQYVFPMSQGYTIILKNITDFDFAKLTDQSGLTVYVENPGEKPSTLTKDMLVMGIDWEYGPDGIPVKIL